MPSYDKVSIMDRSGAINYYSSYSSARSAASSGDLIQIWASLDNEQIELKDGVDLWIMPGVVVDNKNGIVGGATISDNNISVTCNIYGEGVIKNTRDVGSTWYECIKIINPGTNVSVDCNYIEGIGGTTPNSLQGPCIYIVNASKFHLNCNRIFNQRDVGIWIGSTSNVINDVNLNIEKIETGSNVSTTYYGESSLITHCNGFVEVDQIICKNLGHCLSHRGGKIVANVRKLTTTANISGGIAVLHVPGSPQGSGDQNLILCFDEINSLSGTSFNSGVSVEFTGGYLSLLGRKLFSKDLYGVICGGILQKGQIICNEIISENFYALNIANYNTEVSITANLIKSNYQPSTGFSPVLYLSGTTIYHPKCLIKNAYLINQNNATNAKGIFFENIYPVLTLYNVKIVAGSEDDNIIYLSNGTSVDVYNYGTYGNKNIDDNIILLKIGNPDNYLFIENNNLA